MKKMYYKLVLLILISFVLINMFGVCKKVDSAGNNTIYTYRTMIDALADNVLAQGMVFETNGYYTFGDGGGGTYLVTTYNPNDGNPCYMNYANGLYIRYIFNGGVANILALGAKRDNTGDCSPIIQGFANATQSARNKLYFPQGIYRCETPITLTDKFNFEGCAPYRAGQVFWYNNVLYSTSASTLYFPSNANDTTFITCNIPSNGFGSLKNLCIMSDSTEWSFDGWTTRPTIPYNVYHLTDKYTNVNGLDATTMVRLEMDGCCFMGWSGYGSTVKQVFNIQDSYWDTCGIGVKQTTSDAMLYDCYITHCRIGIQASNGVLFAYNIFIDQCIEYGIKGSPTNQTSLRVTGTIDHIGYSAICLNLAYDVEIDCRIGRCGMFWAGANKEAIPNDFDTLSQASNISIKRLKHGIIKASTYLRDITDTDAENYALPIYMLNGEVWEKATVIGLYHDEYDICSPLFNRTSKIGLFTYDGFHQLFPLVTP